MYVVHNKTEILVDSYVLKFNDLDAVNCSILHSGLNMPFFAQNRLNGFHATFNQ